MNRVALACTAVICLLPACAQKGSHPTGPLENSLGMKLVPVPRTDVRFCIWETRVRDYEQYVAATKKVWVKAPSFITQRPDDPAVNVNWAEANAFCEWLTAKEQAEGRIGRGERYRLPTDAEWSRAVGIGDEEGASPSERQAKLMLWPWGGCWPPPGPVGNYFDQACKRWHRAWKPDWGWYIIDGYDDGFSHLASVGSFPPNALGLYDMGGNVWEWCADEEGGKKILRGAGWYDSHPVTLLSASRNTSRGESGWDVGFRIVLADAASKQTIRRSNATGRPAQREKAGREGGDGPAPTTRPSVAWPGQDMVPIEGGTFQMGDLFQESADAWLPEVPVHRVTLGAFHLGRYEVTVEQFVAFVSATGYVTEAEKEDCSSVWVTWDSDTKSTFAPVAKGITWRNPGFEQSEADPVVCLSWNDAIAYCNWLSKKAGVPPAYDLSSGEMLDASGKPAKDVRTVSGYRLPTEAEWEYAARERGRKVRFGNGKDIARAEEINFYASQGAYTYAEKGRYRKRTTPVGNFPPNATGLFDMSGNAWEWCSDCYAEYSADDVDNPYISRGSDRILRGGRWGGTAKEIRASGRHGEGRALRCNNSGFRIARTATP